MTLLDLTPRQRRNVLITLVEALLVGWVNYISGLGEQPITWIGLATALAMAMIPTLRNWREYEKRNEIARETAPAVLDAVVASAGPPAEVFPHRERGISE